MSPSPSPALLCAALCLAAGCAPPAPAPPGPCERILFGSCIQQDWPAPIWEAVLERQPDLFLLLGDNVYGDTVDMQLLRQKYDQLGAQPGFASLRASCPLLATWDDHDYGRDDAGAEYPRRSESQAVFNDFFAVPRGSPRRRRPGVYDAAVFGPEGRRVQVILLDTRYFRDPLSTWAADERPAGLGPYRPHAAGPGGTGGPELLGEAQWQWLADELRRPAEVRIVASSIQVIACEHGWETWGNFPAERQRLFDLIAASGAGGVLFVSGDRHLAELSRLGPEETGVGYALHDVTSSSLNKPTRRDVSREPNSHRLQANYPGENFGCIEIDWTADDPQIELTVRDVSGEPVISLPLRLGELQPAAALGPR